MNSLTRTEGDGIHQHADDIGIARDHPKTAVLLRSADWAGLPEVLVDLIDVVMVQIRGMVIKLLAPARLRFIGERFLDLVHYVDRAQAEAIINRVRGA